MGYMTLNEWREKAAVGSVDLARRQKISGVFLEYDHEDRHANHRVVVIADNVGRNNSRRTDVQFTTRFDEQNAGVIKRLTELKGGEKLEVGLLRFVNNGKPALEYLRILATGEEYLVHHPFETSQE